MQYKVLNMPSPSERLKWLQMAVNASGRDQSVIAEDIDIDPSHFNQVVKGKRALTDKMIYKVAKELRVQPPRDMGTIEFEPAKAITMARSSMSGRFDPNRANDGEEPYVPKLDDRTLALAVLNLQSSVRDALDFIKEQGEMIRELHSELISKKRKA